MEGTVKPVRKLCGFIVGLVVLSGGTAHATPVWGGYSTVTQVWTDGTYEYVTFATGTGLTTCGSAYVNGKFLLSAGGGSVVSSGSILHYSKLLHSIASAALLSGKSLQVYYDSASCSSNYFVLTGLGIGP